MKLYWRYKKDNGKWTWKAARRHPPGDYIGKLGHRFYTVYVRGEEE